MEKNAQIFQLRPGNKNTARVQEESSPGPKQVHPQEPLLSLRQKVATGLTTASFALYWRFCLVIAEIIFFSPKQKEERKREKTIKDYLRED